MQARGRRDEHEEGWNASEGEGLYRYVPAAVVCNIMITLSLPATRLPPSFSLSLSVYLTFSLFHSLPSYAYTRLPGGHPLSAAMLPGNMIIVIICTLLRSYPPDSSPLRNSLVILPEWLPPFSLSFSLHLSIYLSLSLSPSFPPSLSSSLFLSRSIPTVVPFCVMLCSSLLLPPFSSRESLAFPPSLA